MTLPLLLWTLPLGYWWGVTCWPPILCPCLPLLWQASLPWCGGPQMVSQNVSQVLVMATRTATNTDKDRDSNNTFLLFEEFLGGLYRCRRFWIRLCLGCALYVVSSKWLSLAIAISVLLKILHNPHIVFSYNEVKQEERQATSTQRQNDEIQEQGMVSQIQLSVSLLE